MALGCCTKIEKCCFERDAQPLISNGFPIDIIESKVHLTTTTTPIKEQVFCIVDIETNGNNVKNGQIIELGAVKYQNGEIIDKENENPEEDYDIEEIYQELKVFESFETKPSAYKLEYFFTKNDKTRKIDS